MKKMLGIAFVSAAVLALAACGSSGDDAPAAPAAPVVTTDIPSSATANAAGLLAFANAQIAASSDSSEPILVGDATLPVDDTTETSL